MQLRKPLSLILIAILMFSSTVVLLPAETALAHEGDDKMDEGVAFLVRIENISADSDPAYAICARRLGFAQRAGSSLHRR